MLTAGIAMADPGLSLRAIGAQLEAMRERTPRGGRQWAASSVKNLLDQAARLGCRQRDAPGHCDRLSLRHYKIPQAR